MIRPSTAPEISRPGSPPAVLETVLYAIDLEAAHAFYSSILGLVLIAREPEAHVFFRCGEAMLLIFNPAYSRKEHDTANGGTLIPRHGATGEGHVAFRIDREQDIDRWKAWLENVGVSVEQEIHWEAGGRSIYFRDPAGNSVELATPALWGLPHISG